MRLRFQGIAARDGWAPGEERDVGNTDAAPLLASGAWVAVLEAPCVGGPERDRMIKGPEVKPWP